MAESKEHQQDDDAIEIAGQEGIDVDDDELEPETDIDSEADDTDDDELDIDGEADGDDDDESDEDDDDTDDDADDEDEPEETPARTQNVRDIADDDDVQLALDDLEEQRRQLEFELSHAKEADTSFLKKHNLQRYNYRYQGQPFNIYTADDDSFDVFMEAFEEHENTTRQQARELYKARAKFESALSLEEQRIQSHEATLSGYEWSVISQRAPLFVSENEKEIADWIRTQMEKDSMMAKRANSFKGKLYLLNQAVKALKLTESSKKKAKKKRPEPSIHKTKAKGKTRTKQAQPRHRDVGEFRKWVNTLSADEYDKHESYIDKMYEKFTKK